MGEAIGQIMGSSEAILLGRRRIEPQRLIQSVILINTVAFTAGVAGFWPAGSGIVMTIPRRRR